MATFLLVHGAWHGGWCWDAVRKGLAHRGHASYAPTLIGLGERSSLLRPGLSLDAHVQDVASFFDDKPLQDVVLVGHSYAGALLPAIAEQARGRIAKLLFLDAAVLEDGESLFSMMDPKTVEQRRRDAVMVGDVPTFAVPPPQALGFSNDLQWARIEPRLTPHPLSTYETPLRLAGKPGEGMPCDYIRCTAPTYAPLGWARERARRYGWPMHDLASGHDAMLLAPDSLVDMLDATTRNHSSI